MCSRSAISGYADEDALQLVQVQVREMVPLGGPSTAVSAEDWERVQSVKVLDL